MRPKLCAIALSLLCLAGRAQAQRVMINSFESDADLRMLEGWKVDLARVTQGVTDGDYALQVTFNPAEWAYLTFTPDSTWNFAGYSGLALDITNPMSTELHFQMRVDDDVNIGELDHYRLGEGTVWPGETATFFFPAGADPMDYGMRALPILAGARSLGSAGNWGVGDVPFEYNHVVQFRIFIDPPQTPQTLIIDNVRLEPWIPLDGIVDEFGQYSGADWPGKIHSDQEMADSYVRELAELQRMPALPDRDAYGGWASGPQLQATGMFRTEKVNGKWWFVTPDGHLFYSMGIDCLDMNGVTMTTGRTNMFTWLPGDSDPLKLHFRWTDKVVTGPVKSGWEFNFLTCNLNRKYGDDFENAYTDMGLRRMASWGFNTIGNWSDAHFQANGRVPYVATVSVTGNHHMLAAGSDRWGTMHDPFDPQFPRDVEDSIWYWGLYNWKGDPWCLGYMVDNELNLGRSDNDYLRYGLAIAALQEPWSPAGLAFTASLLAEYGGNIAALNAAWNTGFYGFNAIDPGAMDFDNLTSAARQDLGSFCYLVMAEYSRIVRNTIERIDPGHLYLGSRLPGGWFTPETLQAAADYSDVVSTNIYAQTIDPDKWGYLANYNKPFLIGEFHFGATDRGLFHPGLLQAPNQEVRSRMYQEYVRSVVDSPVFVGCHWFQYSDQPLTGRTRDGESGNIGFVSVADEPYPEMVNAAREVNAEVYPRRYSR